VSVSLLFNQLEGWRQQIISRAAITAVLAGLCAAGTPQPAGPRLQELVGELVDEQLLTQNTKSREYLIVA
jgi:hypothetical protein